MAWSLSCGPLSRALAAWHAANDNVVIIRNLSQSTSNGLARIEGTVHWEESDHPATCLFFESLGEAGQFWPDPNAFLIGCILPAWKDGERRILVDGALCPVLVRGLKVAVAMLGSWRPELNTRAPVIESTTGLLVRSPSSGQALSLLSCGVDSTAALRWNMLNIPSDHPESIRGVLVMAHVEKPTESAADLIAKSGGRLEAVKRVADSADVEPIPLVTNLLSLADGYFFTFAWHGAVLASIASLFSNRFRKGFLAGTHKAPDLKPWGSSALVDPYYSTAHFAIGYDGFESSRAEKLELLVDWEVGLSNLRVCQNDDGGSGNCGTCEKCIRTMIELVIINKLDSCDAFPRNDVDEALIWTLDEYDMINRWANRPWYEDMVIRLARCGRRDLSVALDAVLGAAASRGTT